jgi:hypothetical protein
MNRNHVAMMGFLEVLSLFLRTGLPSIPLRVVIVVFPDDALDGDFAMDWVIALVDLTEMAGPNEPSNFQLGKQIAHS